MKEQAIRGDIVFTRTPDRFEIIEDGYLLIQGETILEVVKTLPPHYPHQIIDHKGQLIIPGFVDLHIHAPQVNNIGLGADMELLQWLNTYTFPEEALYEDPSFAEEAYRRFVRKLWKNGTTSSVIFGTTHNKSNLILMELLEKSGLSSYVGKVNMDRNAPKYYMENTKDSIEDTLEFIETAAQRFSYTKPIITPRFVPSCSHELMIALGQIAEKYQLKIQSHLSENRKEIAWVKELHPNCPTYAHVYEKYGLLRENYQTIMAHCVWSEDQELSLLQSKQILVAHSPFSNGNLSSGIASISKMLSMGIPVGLASDISGGHQMFMGRLIVEAEIFSKMKWVYDQNSSPALTQQQLFYMATKGAGRFFGKVGSFEPGYQADFLIIDDADLADSHPRDITQRLQRFLYIGDDRHILYRYARGNLIDGIL